VQLPRTRHFGRYLGATDSAESETRLYIISVAKYVSTLSNTCRNLLESESPDSEVKLGSRDPISGPAIRQSTFHQALAANSPLPSNRHFLTRADRPHITCSFLPRRTELSPKDYVPSIEDIRQASELEKGAMETHLNLNYGELSLRVLQVPLLWPTGLVVFQKVISPLLGRHEHDV